MITRSYVSTEYRAVRWNPLLHVLYCVASLALVQPIPGKAASGHIIIGPVTNLEDHLEFGFTSTWAAGVSYQAQFLRAMDGAWVDIPDAQISQTGQGTFLVSAPSFGGASGFYRVLSSESMPSDPLAETLDQPDPEEILVLWNQQGTNTVSGKLYYYVETSPGGAISNSMLSAYPPTNSPPFSFGTGSPVDASGAEDSLVTDLNGDGKADPLFVWADPAGYIDLSFSQIISSNFQWEASGSFHLTNLLVRPYNTVPPVLRVVAAHLDSDPRPEVVLAYTGADGMAHIALLAFDSNLATVTVKAEIADAQLPFVSADSLRDRSARFDIAAGDFDGDGLDEIALVAPEAITVPNGIENWDLYVRFYNYDQGAAQFIPDTIPHANTVLYSHNDRSTRWMSRVAAQAADFDGDGRAELAIGWEVAYSSQPNPWFLQIIKPAPDFQALTKTPLQGQQVDQINGSTGYPLSLLTGNFDDDPLPELVYGSRKLMLFNIQTNLAFTEIGEGVIETSPESDDRRFLGLAHYNSHDPNAGSRPEIVAVNDTLVNDRRVVGVQTFKLTGDAGSFLNIEPDATIYDDTGSPFQRHYALGTADFGGNGIKLGTPRRFTRTVIGKPTVILNAPPVHFDIFNGTPYDVDGLFPIGSCAANGTCPFSSIYAGNTTRGVTVATDWKRSWDFSQSVSGGFEVPIVKVGVDIEVKSKFGQDLDNYASSSVTTRVDVQVNATGDDRIYAAAINYNIWEYPVLVDGQTVGHIVVLDPGVVSQNWFGSKSIIAQNYQPYHEVGNLLSYRSTTVPYSGAQYVRSISGDTFTVDPSSGYLWQLTRTTNATTTSSQTFNFDISASASFDIPNPFIRNVTLAGGYHSSKLEQSTSTISDEQGLTVRLGNLDGSIAGSSYSVTPYVYWDRSGAVVLDYAVQLPAGTPAVPTFWGQNYSAKPDLSFILPWRWDPEKGENLTDPSLRQLTRDIITLPVEPRPGEAVTLAARISNFSLLGTTGPFVVRFYLGDPMNGGQLITGTDGRTDVQVSELIPAQEKLLVELPWRIPVGLTGTSIKIYAVIDPINQVDEIHEDNNVGWNEIFLRTTP